MIKYCIRFILFAFFPLVSFAQSPAPETFSITTDTAAEIKLDGKYWRIWDDSAGNTEFKIVSSPEIANRFLLFDTTKKFDFSVRTFWYKLKLKNTLNKQVEIGLPTGMMYWDIYFADSTLQWQHRKTGSGYHKSARDGYKLLNAATITLEPNQEIVVFARQHNSLRFSPSRDLALWFMDAALQKKFDVKNRLSPISDFENIINAFLLGMIFITCIFNLTFYRV